MTPTLRRLAAISFLALIVLVAAAADPQPPAKPRLPNQGGFRNGQAMWDWMGGAGEIWWDGGNPIYNAEKVRQFVNGQTGDAMRHPRPKKVRLYMQGWIPPLPKIGYAEAAQNSEAFQKEWKAMAQACVDGGYTQCVFGTSETQTDSKKWHPTAEDITSGRWRKAWINMVEAVRSVMPDAQFAFVPMSSGQSSDNARPDNGILEKDQWYVDGQDSRGKPYMDFWGATLYFNLHGTGCSANTGKPVTKEVIDLAMSLVRKPADHPHTNWGYMGQYQYAKEKGLKLVIGESGIMDRFAKDRPFGMGDQPYAIDLLTKLLSDHADQIELVCWFNSRNTEGGKKVWSRLDAGSSMPKAAQRLKELWGPDSPYRK